MRKMTRREVMAATAAVIPAVGLLTRGVAPDNRAVTPSGAAPRSAARGQRPYSFFDATEAKFIEAACERLIPADSSGSGARDTGVPRYLDRHLADAWGNGARLYRLGQWQPGTPSEKLQQAKPAELFRAALSAIHRDLSLRGTSFAELPAAAQDDYLASLEAGLPIPGVATKAFFDLLLLMTTEGFFATNSAGASHRDRLAWPLRGFPGAYASASGSGGDTRRQEAAGDIP
jgi:gluconate 2-dehydrogenase gamma chain